MTFLSLFLTHIVCWGSPLAKPAGTRGHPALFICCIPVSLQAESWVEKVGEWMGGKIGTDTQWVYHKMSQDQCKSVHQSLCLQPTVVVPPPLVPLWSYLVLLFTILHLWIKTEGNKCSLKIWLINHSSFFTQLGFSINILLNTVANAAIPNQLVLIWHGRNLPSLTYSVDLSLTYFTHSNGEKTKYDWDN